MTQPPNQPPPPPGQFPPPPEGDGGAGVPPNPYGTPQFGGPGEPKKSRTGLIIAIGVAVAVLVVGGVLLIGFIGLGNDADSGKDDADTSDASDTSDTSDTSEEPKEAGEGDISGDGYHFALPEGWHDISTSKEVTSQPTLDTGAADAKTIVESSANVLVEMVEVGDTSIEDVRDQLRTTYETQFGATVEDLPDREIGGENTLVLTMTRPSTSNPKVQVEQVSYVLVRDGTAYVITSSRAVDFPKTEGSVEEILDSWVWE